MSQLEIYKNTINHEPSGTFLYYAQFTPDLLKRIQDKLGVSSAAEVYSKMGMFTPKTINPLPLKKLEKADLEIRYGKYYKSVERPEGSFINDLGVLKIPGSMYHFTHLVSPLRKAKTVSELEKFVFPGEDPCDDSHMEEQVRKAHKAGFVTRGQIGHIYEDAWQIRGYEEFLSDMILAPEMCEYILDRIMNRNIRRAETAAKAGVDYLHTGDDVANQNSLMFAPDTWRKFIRDRWAKVYAAAKRIKPDIKIWYHSDGNIMEIIPELIDIGVDILNPVQPECMDIYGIKKKYGNKLVIDGTIGTQSTMPFGTPEDVRAAVKDRKEKLGYDGALIISPTHVLEPDVPVENVLAFWEECRNHKK